MDEFNTGTKPQRLNPEKNREYDITKAVAAKQTMTCL